MNQPTNEDKLAYLHRDRQLGLDPDRDPVDRSRLWQSIADAWPNVAAKRLHAEVPPVRTNGGTAEVIQLAVEMTLRAIQHPSACDECGHASDCALHNRPALPIGPCDCGLPRVLADERARAALAAVRALYEAACEHGAELPLSELGEALHDITGPDGEALV